MGPNAVHHHLALPCDQETSRTGLLRLVAVQRQWNIYSWNATCDAMPCCITLLCEPSLERGE